MPQRKKQSTGSLYLDQLKFDKQLFKSPIFVLIKNVRLLALIILALVIGGVYSFFNLPRELNPEVKIPIVSVVTTLPGADPVDVEELVTKPIEKELKNLSNVDVMSSTSRDSVSIVSLQFLSNVDPDKALQDSKEKIDLVDSLPENAGTPIVNKLDFNDQPVWTVAITGDIDLRSLSRIAEDLQDKLEANSGIRKVELNGQQQEEIVVALNASSLQRYNLSADSISQVISASNVTIPAGAIQVNSTKYQLSVDNKFTSVEKLRQLPVPVGRDLLTLGEVADVYLRAEESDDLTSYRQSDGKNQPAIQLNIYKTNNETISGAVNSAEEIIEQELADYSQVSTVSVLNNAEEVEKSFAELGSNFRDTIILVFTILFLFLGFRQAATASLSIPLTFFSAFILMSIMGVTMNFLSLFSLLLALGLVVDDAIVIVQASYSYGKKFNPIETGLLVFRDFVVPIWTTTITTVWAFVPLLLASGIIGEFIKSIPIVVTATLLSSTSVAVLINLPLTVIFAKLDLPKRVKWLVNTLIALGVTAAIFMTASGSPLFPVVVCSWLVLAILMIWSRKTLQKQLAKSIKQIKPARKNTAKFDLFNQGIVDLSRFTEVYKNMLRSILKNKHWRWGMYAASLAFFVISFVIFPATGLLKSEFFPKTDMNNLYINLEGPTGWPREKMLPIIDEVEEKTLEVEEIDHLISQTGGLVSDGFGGSQTGSHLAYLAITLDDEENRDRSSIEIARELRDMFEGYPEINISVVESSGGPPVGADLEVQIFGDELETLEQISKDFEEALHGMPNTINISSSLKPAAGQIVVELDEYELRQRGLVAAQVAGWLRTAVSGVETSEITLDSQDLNVKLELQEQQLDMAYLSNLRLPSQLGDYSLAEVAKFKLETSPALVEHEDGQRVVKVSAAASGISAPELLQNFEEKVADYQMPNGYTWQAGGANEENQESSNSIIQAMGISALLILITMVLQLNSFRKSILVLSVIPLAVAGVFFNFTILGIPLSFPALIGVLALFGIVVNNSIMLVEKINQHLKMESDFVENVIDACASRVEAIFFTSLTTAIGLLPITISDPLWRGLGGSIIAGLTFSGVLILFLLPAVFVEIYKK
jgi:multidrug efflux pump subunit AcrB